MFSFVLLTCIVIHMSLPAASALSGVHATSQVVHQRLAKSTPDKDHEYQ